VNSFGQTVGATVEGWSERSRPERTVLTGNYCRVEPVDVERHAAALYAAYMQTPDARDWTYLFYERPESAELFYGYLETLAASSDPLHFTIVASEGGQPLGTAALMRIEPVHGVIEIGSIGYSALLKQTRAGTEAMYLLMCYVFDKLRYRRYEWKCDSLNAPSCAAARRYGFQFEGIFRKAIIYKNRSRDTAWFSIIEEEWPLIRTAFEIWLDPDNFDPVGRQRRALAAIRDSL